MSANLNSIPATSIVTAALGYTGLGWAVFPLHNIQHGGNCSCGKGCGKDAGKHPRTAHGFKDASTDPKQITKWWEKWPDANIGITTGKVSGIYVVDVDPRNGGDTTLDELTQDKPSGVYANTGGDGLHLLFKYDEGLGKVCFPHRNRKQSGIDIKTDGGYIVAPPSNHLSGGIYAWGTDADPIEGATLSPLPDWVIKCAEKPNSAFSGAKQDYMAKPLYVDMRCLNDLRGALTFFDADDRDEWIWVGMALKTLGLNGSLIWEEWAKRSEKFDPDETQKRFLGFKATDINYKAIFTKAMGLGWVNPLSNGASLRPVQKPLLGLVGLEPKFDNLDLIKIPKGIISEPQMLELTKNFFVAKWGDPAQIIEESDELTVYKKNQFELKFAQYSVRTDGKPISVYVSWSGYPKRRSYRNVVFKPNENCSPEDYNLFRGFSVEPVEGDWSDYQTFVRDIICDGNLERYEYALNWMAQLFQHPGQLSGTVIVLYSKEHGTGKNFFAKTISDIIGSKHCPMVSNDKHLIGNFNAHLEQAIFLTASEALFSGNIKIADAMKSLITEDQIMIERKGVNAYMAENILSVLITSNHDQPVHMEKGDRRYADFKVNPRRKKDRPYFKDLREQMSLEGNAAMLYDLLQRDINSFNPEKIPQSIERTEQILLGMDSRERWLYQCCLDGSFFSDDPAYDEAERDLGIGRDVFDVVFSDGNRGSVGFESSVPTELFWASYCRFCSQEKINYIGTRIGLTKYLADAGTFGIKRPDSKDGRVYFGKTQKSALITESVEEVMKNFE